MPGLPAYRAHLALSDPARGTAQLWRLAVGVIVIFVVFLTSLRAVQQVLRALAGAEGVAAAMGSGGGSSALSVLFMLFSFGLLLPGVAVALRVAHRRGFLEVLGAPALLLRQFLSVLAMIGLLYLVLAVLPPWSFDAPLVPNLSPGAWLMLLPFGLAAVLVQVTAEEVLFRGYLQQQLAARFSSPLVWLGIPAALFGAGHYQPAAGDIGWLIAFWSTLFGIAAADLTARAGTLGPAIALHFANNVVAILVVAMPDSLSGLALYLTPFELGDTAQMRDWMPVEFLMILVTWLAARLAIRA